MFNNTHLNDHSKIVKFNYNYPFKLFFGKSRDSTSNFNKRAFVTDCPAKCGGRACMADGQTCCHSTCLGGCDGPLPSDCHVCANFSFRYGKERTCMESCPANTYMVRLN